MARTTLEIAYHSDFDQAEKTISRILTSNGFNQTTSKSGENVWKKGSGLMTAMQFIKTDFATDKVIFSAWVQVGIGSVGGEEMDLTGFAAGFPKKQLMKVLQVLKAEL